MTSEMNAAQWLATESPQPTLIVVGVPNSKSTKGSAADLAPLEVRHRLTHFPSFNADSGTDLRDLPARDMGNLAVSNLDPTTLLEELPQHVAPLPDCFRLYLGGDNAITRPLAGADMDSLESTGLIRFDSQRGTDDLDAGASAGNIVSGLIADGMLAQNVVEIGTHSFTNARESEITSVPVTRITEIGIDAAIEAAFSQLEECSRIYVNVDLGVLDRSVAPGAPDARPGGLTIRELAAGVAQCARHPAVTALDLVGVDPTLDRDSQTLDIMAYLLLTAAAGLSRR